MPLWYLQIRNSLILFKMPTFVCSGWADAWCSADSFSSSRVGFWGGLGWAGSSHRSCGWWDRGTNAWAPMTKPAIPTGDPLQCGAWVGQCALYIVIMIFEKSVVFIVLLILQWKKVCLLFPSLPASWDAKQDSTPHATTQSLPRSY